MTGELLSSSLHFLMTAAKETHDAHEARSVVRPQIIGSGLCHRQACEKFGSGERRHAASEEEACASSHQLNPYHRDRPELAGICLHTKNEPRLALAA